MKLELVSLSGVVYSGDAYEVVIPTADGEIAVYPGHMPLISLAVPGVLTIRKQRGDTATEPYAMLGGVIQVDGELLRILVDEVEHADDIFAEEAKRAYDEAVKLKAEAKNAVDLEKAQSLMDRHAVRLKVADLRRRHPRR